MKGLKNMLSEPVSLTVNSVAKSLPRTATPKGLLLTKVATSHFNTSDGVFALKVERFVSGPYVRMQVSLQQTDVDDLDGKGNLRKDTFGVFFDFIPTSDEAVVNIATLRTALLAFLDSTTTSRILGGEM
jgi:hypothetical protein